MIDWYFDYLTHRNINITLHGETLKASVFIGFPQGGIASAKFWLIAFDEVVSIINSYGIWGNAFADNCTALVGGTHVGRLRNKLQKCCLSLLSGAQVVALNLTLRNQ